MKLVISDNSKTKWYSKMSIKHETLRKILWYGIGVVIAIGLIIFVFIEFKIKNEAIRNLQDKNQLLLVERDKYEKYANWSIYYTNMARVIWGKYAGSCDVGLIIKIEKTIAETRADSVGIDVPLVLSVISIESGFNRYIKSYAGAIGIMQLMPTTAKMHIPAVTENDLYDENVNLRAGILELKRLMIVFNRDKEMALLAYNRGEKRVKELVASGQSPRNQYSTKVLNLYFYN